MKNLYLLITIILLSAFGCKKDHFANEDKFNASLNSWNGYKASVHNSYIYTQKYGSIFGGETDITIAVTKGKITKRDFYVYIFQPNSQVKNLKREWHEDAATINTHGTDGGEALTLDQVYDKARTVWLKTDANANDILLETNNNGMISSCGFIPHGCQDDCFNGIKITSVTAL